MKSIGRQIRNSFGAGLLVVIPLALSVGILWWLFNTVTNFLLPRALRDLMSGLPYHEFLFRIVALVTFAALVTLIGWITRLVIGRRMLRAGETLINRVPLLNKMYAFMKQVSYTMLGRKKTVFERVVLVEYPRQGIYAIGFVTSETQGEVQQRTTQEVLNIFLPTTPNPTSGFLLMVPREDLIELDMTVADGMKLVISAGAVVPEYRAASAATARASNPAPEQLPDPSAR